MCEKMMKAAVLHAPGDIRYEDYPMPELKSGHVRIRVRACGICGSDVPRVLGNAAHYYPIVLGHEFSGEIAETAEDVNGFEIGDRVVCASLIPCYQCPDCAAGNYSLCKHYTFIGSRIQGGFSDYVTVPAGNAVRFSPEYSFEEAALIEPATVALHGLLCGDYRGGGTAAVVGAGTIGLFTAQWAQILGASEVVFFDVDDDRLRLAEEITGFRGFNTRTGKLSDALAEFTAGRGFNYVFATSGAPAGFLTCLELTANKAKVCLIGTPAGDITFTAAQWELINRRELQLNGSWMSYTSPFPGRAWTMCAEYLSSGRLKCDRRMIHRIFDMKDARAAFDCYRDPRSVKGRILLVNR